MDQGGGGAEEAKIAARQRTQLPDTAQRRRPIKAARQRLRPMAHIVGAAASYLGRRALDEVVDYAVDEVSDLFRPKKKRRLNTKASSKMGSRSRERRRMRRTFRAKRRSYRSKYRKFRTKYKRYRSKYKKYMYKGSKTTKLTGLPKKKYNHLLMKPDLAPKSFLEWRTTLCHVKGTAKFENYNNARTGQVKDGDTFFVLLNTPTNYYKVVLGEGLTGGVDPTYTKKTQSGAFPTNFFNGNIDLGSYTRNNISAPDFRIESSAPTNTAKVWLTSVTVKVIVNMPSTLKPGAGLRFRIMRQISPTTWSALHLTQGHWRSDWPIHAHSDFKLRNQRTFMATKNTDSNGYRGSYTWTIPYNTWFRTNDWTNPTATTDAEQNKWLPGDSPLWLICDALQVDGDTGSTGDVRYELFIKKNYGKLPFSQAST